MKRFKYFEYHSLEEVLNLLNQYQGTATILAGGTNLLIKMKKEILSPLSVVNLKKVKALDDIQLGEKSVQAGAFISGDLTSPLVALKVDLLISSLRGDQVIPLEELLAGGKVPNILKKDEILKDVLIPFTIVGTGTAFVKYAKGGAVDFSPISVAAVMSRSPSDRNG